jgi:hypothetical protein
MAALISGYRVTAAVGALARLGVADALAGGPATTAEVAARMHADPRSLGDTGLLRTLDDGRIALTDLGALLRGDVPGSMRRAAIMATEEWRWRAYGHLSIR